MISWQLWIYGKIDMISASDILKEYLESHAISQRQVSKELGVTQAHISKILSRELFMSVKLAREIEIVYGLSARTLLILDIEYKLKQLEK